MVRKIKNKDWNKALWALRQAYKVYQPTRSSKIKRAIAEAGKIVKEQDNERHDSKQRNIKFG